MFYLLTTGTVFRTFLYFSKHSITCQYIEENIHSRLLRLSSNFQLYKSKAQHRISS